MYKNLILKIFCFGLIALGAVSVPAQKKTTPTQTTQTTRTITVVSEPNAVVWLNDIRYGATDEEGRLTIKTVSAGAKQLRVRAEGFKEATQNLPAAQKGEIKVALTKTTDEAEIAFQQGEAFSVTDREKAIEMYKKAVALRPKYMQAQLALARTLSANSDTDAALKAVREAKKWRPGYAEISAVEGRIHAAAGDEAEAIAAFKRAIAEGKGFQPEAHAGLANLYREKAETFSAEGDFDSEKEYYLMAAAELKKAVAQLSGAPDALVLIQLLGDSYERAKMYKEAIKVYEDFLRLFPDTSEAVTVRSFITQLEKQMSEEQE